MATAAGEGNHVDSDPGGPSNQAACSQSPSDDQMETTPQAAASGPVESPESGSSGTDTVDEVEKKAEEKVQNEQGAVDPKILKKLRDVMSKSYKYPIDDEGLKECITKTSIDPKQLLHFFKNVEDRYENTDRGGIFSRLSGFWSKPNAKNLTPQVKTVKVHSVVTGLTSGADDEILEEVKTLLSSTTRVEITDCQQCDIIIVFCPITTRVGADVPAAMNNIPGNKPVILVLMHHTRDDDYSTVKKWSETNQNVLLDVHVLFHETLPGLLKCPRNDEAVQQIQKVVKAHSK